MRGITFVLLVTFVGCQKNDLEPGFSIAKSFFYTYNGFIQNGLENTDLAKSALKLTCQVKISRVSQEDHILKVLSPQVEEYNGILMNGSLSQTTRLTQKLYVCFAELFKFEYKRGCIGNIYAPKNISIECINIIRGILDLLQITIEKSESVYELQEDGIGGTCHTRYVIQEDKINNKTTISRTKDLNNCTVKVVKNIGMAYIQPCPTCAVNITNTRGTVAFNYKLKYMDTGALITHVDSQQVYAISPFNELGGTAIMDARQNLTLIETTSNQERMPGILLQNYGSLHYQFPQDLPQMALHLIKMNSTESSIVEMLEQLIQQNQLQLHPETPSKFLELIELSRAATHENLESLWKQFADRQQYRSWLLSAVGAAGTTDTFMFLKQRIHNEDLSFLESTVTLTLAFHLTKTNGLILKEAADLMTSPGVQKSLVLHNLAYLAYGSMINRHCLVSSPCPTEILQPLHDLANGAANTTHEEDMVLALKAIGNAGEAASINYIKKFLPEFSLAANALPGRVHIDAVLALRKIARKKAAEIQKILFQIFVNRSLAPKIRIVACVVFFETKPAFPLVTAFASVVQRESNLQVATFAYSHMKVLARGKIPQLDDLSTACRTAIMLLSPRLERMSFRYSRVIHIDGYYPDYRAGAIGRIYLMNNPNTLFPSVIAKIRGYSATSAMDIVEFAFQLEGLADIFKRQDMPFQEYSTYKKIKVLGKLLKGWKELPSEKPLVSTYLKLFSHEIAFALIDKELFEKAKKLVTQPAEKLITLFQKDITGRWTQPILAGELRHTVPTCIGFPLEFGLYTTSVLDVVAQVNGQISPPLTNDFRPDQLLKASIRISADVNSSLYTHMVAVMGINTPHFQTGLEFHAKFHANIPVKFDAKIDMKEEIFKFEITPVQQETELLAVRTKFYAVSRNVDEPNSAKMTPVPPEMIGFDILDQCFKSSENDVKKQQGLRLDITSRTFGYGLKEEFYHSPTKTSCPPSSYVKLSSLGYQTCLTMKQCSTVLLGETYLHKCFGECELKLAVKPGAARTKIQLEIQAGSKSDLRLIQLRHTEEEEDNESSSYVDQRAKRKHGKTKGKKEMAKAKKSGRTEQPTFLGHNKPSVLVAVLRTIQNDKKLTMFHLELHADLHSSRPIVQVFVSDLKESKRPNLCAGVSILDPQRAEGYLNWGQDCRDYKIAAKFEYGQYARYPAMQIKVEWLRIPPRVEAAASGLSTLVPGMAYMFGFSQMEQKNPSQQISVVVALTSPRSCAFVLKLHDNMENFGNGKGTENRKVHGDESCNLIYTYLEESPTEHHETYFGVTIYDTNIWLPLPLPVGQHTEDLEMQPHVWDFISNVPPSVLENLKGHCSVSRGIFTTFNKVSFNYRMPESCYHVLAHDCSPELKFLVMAKKAKQSNDLKMVRINLVSLEVDMYSSSGLVKLRINGTETQAEDLPYYTSSSSEYILIKHEKNGLLLKAPETGIEKLFYDGHMLKIQVPFWMTGKTCGICGRYDAEYEQEYKMPSGSIATNAVSFAQSWILPDDSCARESAAIAGARTNRH